MGGSHGGALLHAPGPLHGIEAHRKLIATVVFVAAVVCTPREQWWAFVGDAVVVAAVARLAGVSFGALLRRLTIELPFVAFAFMLPIIGTAPRVHVAGVALSRPGLLAAWAIVAKGTLGVAATVVLASTTPVPKLIAALERLRVPRTLTAIMAFMLRYGDVVTSELQRMRIARASRGDDPRWLWQGRGAAASVGALFVRSYERGERVHLAMISRGYSTSMPRLGDDGTARHWALCLAPSIGAVALAVLAWSVR